MTVARRLEPGRTHSVTRRTSERRFFLRPSKHVNDVVGYSLALALQNTDVSLHSLLVHTTHTHLEATDGGEHSELPDVLRDFHGLTARTNRAPHRGPRASAG